MRAAIGKRAGRVAISVGALRPARLWRFVPQRSLDDHLRKRGRIPLIDGGLQPLQLVTLAEVLAAVENVFARRLAGTFAIAHPTPIAYRDFYAQLCARLGVRPRFVRVPSALLLAVLEACERLRIRLPITTENVWGLKQARVIDTAPDLAAVGVRVGSADDWLHR